ncbi:hypothetical protein KSY77_09580 [Holdemanella biformis]|nr:hypothetical protein [Holdemanella biformis]MBV4151480.1 hypothetical protein [Holdemanella biformis]
MKAHLTFKNIKRHSKHSMSVHGSIINIIINYISYSMY